MNKGQRRLRAEQEQGGWNMSNARTRLTEERVGRLAPPVTEILVAQYRKTGLGEIRRQVFIHAQVYADAVSAQHYRPGTFLLRQRRAARGRSMSCGTDPSQTALGMDSP